MNKGRQRYFYDNRGFILSYRCYSAYVLLTTGPHTRGGQHKVYIRRHVGEPRFTMLEVWEVLPLSLHNWVTSLYSKPTKNIMPLIKVLPPDQGILILF